MNKRIYENGPNDWVEFVRHIECPDDQYTKELAFVRFAPDHDVLWTKRQGKDGNSYWGIASVGVTVNGKKEYFDTFDHDSKKKDAAIKEFLQKRGWEQAKSSMSQSGTTSAPQWNPNPYASAPQPTSMSEVAQEQPLPF